MGTQEASFAQGLVYDLGQTALYEPRFSSLNWITMLTSQGSYEDQIRGSTQGNVSFDGAVWLRNYQKS